MDEGNAQNAAQARPPQPRKLVVSRRRKWVFRLIALALPFLLLLAGEIICRFGGYGGYPPVLRVLGTVDGRTYVGSNQRGLSTFFFQNLTVVGSMEEQVFTARKAPGAVRIFVLGGSAARGYPQLRSLAASSFLQAMLKDIDRDRPVEMLNLGTTALASFPLMYILDEALRFDPDLIIVYSGNNEFYGAGGVASVHAYGRSTRAMKLFRLARRTALVQWITDVATRQEPESARPGERARTLMERVIADSQIPPDDSRRAAAARNLENHVTYIVTRCRERHVPVILCTLPANERDLAPIGEDVPPPLADAERARFETLLAQGRRALPDDPAAGLAALESASRLYHNPPTLHYLMGKALTALGRHDEALKQYTRAKDLDTMPWRAPSAADEAIRRVAKEGAILCDLERVFEKHSPGGAIGWELMEDHVHPSLRGQALIAEAWLQAMTQLPEPVGVDRAATAELPSWETYAERLGANEFDAYGVAHRMLSLLRAPFYARSNFEALARFEAICAEYESRMTETELRAARVWQDPYTHQGGHRPITGVVGEALLTGGNYKKADRLLTIARREVPPYSLWFLQFTWDALACRQHLREQPLPEDLALAHELIENGELLYRVTGLNHPLLHRHLGLAYNLLNMHESAIPHLGEAVRYVTGPEDIVVVRALAESLVRTGQTDRAVHLLEMPVRNPELREACQRLLADVKAGRL